MALFFLGHFGSVFAATLKDDDMKGGIPVAVKTIEGEFSFLLHHYIYSIPYIIQFVSSECCYILLNSLIAHNLTF